MKTFSLHMPAQGAGSNSLTPCYGSEVILRLRYNKVLPEISVYYWMAPKWVQIPFVINFADDLLKSIFKVICFCN